MASILLLIEDVEDLGRSGDVVKVKPGYARNFLLPRGVAVVADRNALRRQEKLKEERRVKAVQDKTESEQLAKVLETLTLETHVKVDQEGHMYGSVSALDIAHLLQEKHRIAVEKRYVQLKHPIKATGTYTIELKLKEGVAAAVNLNVVPEGGVPNAPKEDNAKKAS